MLFSPINRLLIVQKIIFVVISCFAFLTSCRYPGNEQPATTPSFDSIIARAEHLSDSGYKKEALAFVFAQHSVARDLTVLDEMNYFTYVGEIYRKTDHDYDKFLAYVDSMIAILDKRANTKEYAIKFVQVYSMKAEGLFSKGLFNEAYDYYFRAKTLAQKTADECSLSKYSYYMGMVLYRQQRFDEAAAHFIYSYNESASCLDKFTFFYHRQELLDNIGLSYFGAQKYDSAIFFYNRALAYIDSNYMRYQNKKESVYITAKAVVYGNLGNAYIALGKFDTARALLQKSIDINLQKGFTNNDALVDQVKLANLYYTNGHIPEMKDLLVKIKAEMDTIPDRNVELSWNKLMWNYYDHENDPVNAYQYLSKYIKMNDSFVARNRYLMATDLEGRIKSIERINNINLLEESNERGRLYLVIALLVAMMALIIAASVLRNAARTRKNMEMLTSLNNTVSDQNEKLESALAALEIKDKDKSRILRSVAHDVMNPIAAVQSLADILLHESEGFSDDQKEMLELIKEASANSIALSKDILQAASSLDQLSVEKEWLNINKLISNSIKLLNIQAKAKQQRIILKADNDDIQAYVNKKKIWRLINNLLGNAIKFSHINSEIEIHLATTDEKIHISVIDHGIGIPEKNKAHVFDMFTDAKSTGTAGEVPHGLGLSISMQIARAHGGNIWLESEEGKGTTFHVEIPKSQGA